MSKEMGCWRPFFWFYRVDVWSILTLKASLCPSARMVLGGFFEARCGGTSAIPTQEVEACGWWVWGQPEQHSQTMSQKQNKFFSFECMGWNKNLPRVVRFPSILVFYSLLIPSTYWIFCSSLEKPVSLSHSVYSCRVLRRSQPDQILKHVVWPGDLLYHAGYG